MPHGLSHSNLTWSFMVHCITGSIGLCAGVTNAPYATTTEVYPDSPTADDAQCNRAQVTAIVAALEYIIHAESLDGDGPSAAPSTCSSDSQSE